MDEVDLQNARRRLEQHFNSVFTQPGQWEIAGLSIIGENAHFTVKFYTKAIANSQIENNVYSIRTTIVPDVKELHTLEMKIRAKHADLVGE